MPWHIVFSEDLCPFPSVSRRTRLRYRFINFLPLLTIRYPMSVRCAVQSATSFSETMYFSENSDCLFIPCFELTLLKHLFYLSSRLIIIRFAATRWSFRTWSVVKVGKFVVIGIGSWSWCSWRRTYKVSKFILSYPNFSYKT